MARDTSLTLDRRRYWRIIRFFGALILHLIWWDILIRRVLPGWAARSRPERFRRWARRFRELAVQMGGVLIKLGQFLSARVDVLPVEVTEELQGLQDEVPAVPWVAIQRALSAAFPDLTAVFARVDPTPVAAASLGQVHRAVLKPDAAPPGMTAVVVKVQRPAIATLVRTDLAALRVVARVAMRYGAIRRRANVPALMDEFASTLWEELDYVAEAGNAERFRAMFADDEGVYVPAVYRDHSAETVLVLEDVTGIKITDIDAIRDAGVDLPTVADRLLDVYFHQIFREGFFHADPHPGNLFVRPLPDAWIDETEPCPFELVFVDFGMVGRIQTAVSQNLERVLVAVTQRDARALTYAYRDMGFFLPASDLERIVEAQTVVLNQIWGRKLLDLARPDPAEVEELGREFRDLLFDFPFQIPQDFIYLGRAMGMLSGLVSLLHPEINPWYKVEQFGAEVLRERAPDPFTMEALTDALDLVRPLIALPNQLQRILNRIEENQLRVQVAPDRRTDRRLARLERRFQQINWSLLSASALVTGTLFYLNDNTTVAWAAWAVALGAFLWGARP